MTAIYKNKGEETVDSVAVSNLSISKRGERDTVFTGFCIKNAIKEIKPKNKEINVILNITTIRVFSGCSKLAPFHVSL